MNPCLGIYVHIPFCESKCDYCNFASGVYPDSMVSPYLAALREEILGVKGLLAGLEATPLHFDHFEVDSVYFGGGTPSLIDGRHIVNLMRLLGEVFVLSPKTEVTLEVNPGSANRARVREHLAAGVNRISVGMQTFQNRLLQQIGRSHTVADSFSTLAFYREAGIDNASLDLIAGLPGQMPADWSENLETVQRLSPEHVSMYLLEIHEGTRFGQLYGDLAKRGQTRQASSVPPNHGELTGGAAEDRFQDSSSPPGPGRRPELIPLPDEEIVTQFYSEAVARFAELGYQQYEISNFAQPGRQSRHNLKYWTDQPFFGFGCGAYSYFGGKRWGNERSVNRYIERIREQQHAIDYRSDVTLKESEEEAIFLGLRLTKGIPLPGFQSRFGTDLLERYRGQIAYLREAGLIEFNSDHLRLTPQGWLLSNEVFTELLR